MKHILYVAVIALTTFGCVSQRNATNTLEEMKESEVITLFDNMNNPSDSFLGTYSGLLPCPECAGIQIQITLKSERQLTKKTMHLDTQEIVETSGEYTLNRKGTHLELFTNNNKDLDIYRLENNKIVLSIESDQPFDEEHYTLYKNNNRFTNRLWTAVELKGEKVKNESAELIFRNTKLVSGTGGCNRLFGSFNVQPKERKIEFEKVAMTKMFCHEKHYDEQLAAVLNESNYFFLNKKGQLVFLSKEEKVLGIFNGSSF